MESTILTFQGASFGLGPGAPKQTKELETNEIMNHCEQLQTTKTSVKHIKHIKQMKTRGNHKHTMTHINKYFVSFYERLYVCLYMCLCDFYMICFEYIYIYVCMYVCVCVSVCVCVFYTICISFYLV